MSTAYPLAATAEPTQRDIVADFRSDTLTRPSAEMREVISQAAVGDDVYGEDETVNELERTLSARMGKEAGLFCPTGTQSNLLALLTHCQRGEEIIVGHSYHVFSAEARGASVLGGIALSPVQAQPNGQINADDVEAAVKPDDSHFAITRLLSLENTVAGFVVPLDNMRAAASAARKHKLAVHLDGARVFNAATALGVEVKEVAAAVDTVSVCLSKGLGIPAGSVLCGGAGFIERARRWRKMLGGGMRQSGILAAAGLYALDNHVDTLADDHRRASLLRDFLSGFEQLDVNQAPGQTNMVHLDINSDDPARVVGELSGRGVILGSSGKTQRLVLHRDINDSDLQAAMDAFSAVFLSNTRTS